MAEQHPELDAFREEWNAELKRSLKRLPEEMKDTVQPAFMENQFRRLPRELQLSVFDAAIDMTTSRPTETFHQFLELPLELQQKIFEMAASVAASRILEVKPTPRPRLPFSASWVSTSREPAPVLFHICEHSRLFASHFYTDLNEGSGWDPVWVNPKIDTIYISLNPRMYEIMEVSRKF